MSKRATLRGPQTAQKLSGRKSAFDILLMRGVYLPNQFNRGPLFVTPEPEPTPNPEPKPDPYEERFAKLEAKLNAAHATIRKLQEPKVPAPEPNIEPTPAPKQTAADKALADRLAKIEATATRNANNAKRNEVQTAFAGLGLTEDALKDATDLFILRNGTSVLFDEERGEVIYHDAAADDSKPFNEWFKAQDALGRFKSIKVSKAAPTKGVTQNGKIVSHDAPIEVSNTDLMLGNVSRESLRKVSQQKE